MESKRRTQLDRNKAVEKLRVARHRLETALDRFYGLDLSGNRVALEAAVLDIAVPIRVMVHHVPDRKPPSICLLHQVDPEYWKKTIHFEPLVAPPPRTLPSGVQSVSVAIPLNVKMSAGGTSFIGYRKDTNPAARARLLDWWRNTCWDSGTNKVSNKDLVLAISNKEGGAHVAGDMSAKYRTAKDQGHISIGKEPISDIARLGSLIGVAGGELLEYLEENFGECFGPH